MAEEFFCEYPMKLKSEPFGFLLASEVVISVKSLLTEIETHIAHILLCPTLLAIIESTATTEVQFTKVLLHFHCNLTVIICSAD